VDASGEVVGKAAVLGGAGVGLEGDLQPGHEARAGRCALQEAVDRGRREQARGAAAEEYGVYRAAPDQGQVVVEVGEEGVYVGIEREFAARVVRVEVAVRALAH